MKTGDISQYVVLNQVLSGKYPVFPAFLVRSLNNRALLGAIPPERFLGFPGKEPKKSTHLGSMTV